MIPTGGQRGEGSMHRAGGTRVARHSEENRTRQGESKGDGTFMLVPAN